MAVTLRIGALVVEGMEGADAQALAAALTKALRVRLAAGGAPSGLTGRVANRVDVPHSDDPNVLGRGIAAALVPPGRKA